MNTGIAITVLKEIRQVLADSGVTFWLRRGTCLGAIRNNGLIPWDYDIDLGSAIGLHGFSEESLNQIVATFRDYGFNAGIEQRRFGLYIPLSKLSITTDWCCYRIMNGYIEEYPRLLFPVNLFTGLQEITFIGERFYVPNPPEEYLRLAYGENWRKPKRANWENDALNAMPDISLTSERKESTVKRICHKGMALINRGNAKRNRAVPVVIELVSGYCNAKCVWCFTQYKCLTRMKRGMMSLECFRRFIDLNQRRDFEIIPFSHGEALLNPDFVACCLYAISKGFPLASIHTNLAMPMSDETLDMLSRFGAVIVNVGGATEVTHYQNTGTSLEIVLGNLQRLGTRLQQGIQVKMVVNKRNIDEVGLLEAIVGEINPSIPVKTYPLYFGPSDSDDEDKWRFYRENLEGNSKVKCRDIVKAGENKIEVKPESSECYGLIPTVRWDGSVEICCRGRYHERSLGNAFETPLQNIIDSLEYKQAAAKGLSREYIKYCKYCS